MGAHGGVSWTAPIAPLTQIDGWGIPQAAAGYLVERDGVLVGATRERPVGAASMHVSIASVGKAVSAYAVLIALDEGWVDLADPVGPPGVTVEHLLSHAGGIAFDAERVVAPPGTRRVYSNTGWDLLLRHTAGACGLSPSALLTSLVLEPLGMTETSLPRGATPAAGIRSTLDDLMRFAAELLAPELLPPESVQRAATSHFGTLPGLLPGVGFMADNAWGLGFEVRGEKRPHWTGSRNSPATFGHFGSNGSCLWVDPVARVALVVVTPTPFGGWARDAWPALSDHVLVNVH